PVRRPRRLLPRFRFRRLLLARRTPHATMSAGQVLFVRRGGYRQEAQPFTVAGTPTGYLRGAPNTGAAQPKRADALGLIRRGPNHLNPFYRNRSGSSFEVNEFGAIAFDADHNHGEILSAAQLFLNREIWAFNTISLSPELARSRSKGLGVPT